MKYIPILFSTEMVDAILAEKKTQTRRMFKFKETNKHPSNKFSDKFNPEIAGQCPYGNHGDVLWVRESFAHVPVTAYAHSIGVQKTVNPHDPDMAVVYRAGWDRAGSPPWKPSIHMPRWACRIELKVNDVRLERLKDISADDAIAEGVLSGIYPSVNGRPLMDNEIINLYREIWESMYGEASWNNNPWVWVIDFKVMQKGDK
jgi:hypothetical protein